MTLSLLSKIDVKNLTHRKKKRKATILQYVQPWIVIHENTPFWSKTKSAFIESFRSLMVLRTRRKPVKTDILYSILYIILLTQKRSLIRGRTLVFGPLQHIVSTGDKCGTRLSVYIWQHFDIAKLNNHSQHLQLSLYHFVCVVSSTNPFVKV